MSNSFIIKLRNKISEVSRAGTLLEDYGRKNKIPPEIMNTFILAVDEIVTNVISYGYEDMDEHIIILDLQKNSKVLTIVIQDDARRFNPLELPEADTSKSVEERKIGGLGILLVRKLMDSVEYEYKSGKNFLKIKKRIK
jgi:serine/threonine-protein kinase RsbW